VSLKPAAHLRFAISAWLGGTKSRPVLARRTAAGAVPPGATQAQVILTLATTQTDANGPNAPQAGYDYATAAAITG
jgi:hypothetical protein